MGFPERVYTVEEVQRARELVEKGYKHDLEVMGGPEFKRRVKEALELIEEAGYHDFLRTYIKQLVEIDGFSQLREPDVAIWLNKHVVKDPIEAASFIVQKAQRMKDYLEGKLYYETGEINSVQKRIEFLVALREKSKNPDVKKRCDDILRQWHESAFL